MTQVIFSKPPDHYVVVLVFLVTWLAQVFLVIRLLDDFLFSKVFCDVFVVLVDTSLDAAYLCFSTCIFIAGFAASGRILRARGGWCAHR